jgi:apolipoprotein N-acyltransferase
MISLYWIAIPTVGGMFGAVFILGLYNSLFALCFSFIERRNFAFALAASPIIWTAMEFARGFGRLGFPWLDMGYSQGSYPVIIQMADIIGHRGISLWIVAVNALILAIIIAKKNRVALTIALILTVIAPIAYGISKMKTPEPADTIKVALLQSNISAYQKWDRGFRSENIKYYVSMMDSVHEKVDLIILPETATAYYHRNHPEIVSQLMEASAKFGAPILTGTLDYDPKDPQDSYYNASMVVTSQGNSDCYWKIMLVPMSEQIPFQEYSSFLRKLDLGGSHFSRGSFFKVFDVDGLKFSSPICFEAVFPHVSREFVKNGAMFLANITNDGWFGETPGPYQHENFCRFRAVENHVGICRAAQTGISLIIDPRGVITKSLPLDTKGVLIGDVSLVSHRSIFNRAGDWVAVGSFFLTPILLILIGITVRL